MLQIKNLHASIDDTPILRGVSLAIRPGEVHAIMGPNGSGKSTLAYTLAGHPAYTVDEVHSELLLDSENMLNMSPDERAKNGVFLAFQYPTEIPGISVQNFLRAMWEARFGPLKDNPQKIFPSFLAFRQYLQEQAETLRISPDLLTRNLNEGFSGGERKRVEILQMTLFRPRYAILDETDSGLDIDALKIVAEGAQKSAQDANTGILLITHYQRILEFIQPDFVHIMVNGQIVKNGEKELAQELENTGYKPYLTE